MSKEWEELKQIVSLNNNGNCSEAIKLACTFNLHDKPQLMHAILSIFELTPKFMCQHVNETYKIVNALHGVNFNDIRSSFRASLIIGLFDSITAKKGDL